MAPGYYFDIADIHFFMPIVLAVLTSKSTVT